MRDLKTLESPSSARATSQVARWWKPEPQGKVHCYLCPRHCHIGAGQAGFCFIRANEGGKLYSLGYAHPAALQIDPIEKKPLNHFLPGTQVFSLGTAGCNMGCFFCQNWDISKSRSDQVHSTHMPPEDVVKLALHHGCPSITFTYNEPTIWGEYVIDICKVAHEYGLKTVMVSNGYVTYDAFHDIYDHVDAANIDLKAFTENFYGRTTLTHLQPVLDTLKWLKNETDVWVEITNLMIPTLNDAPGETRSLCEWILENLGSDVPLHFTAFHPDFKLRDKPRTPAETLHAARAIALEVGLNYVYEGNIHSSDGAHTFCSSCDALLIRRSWHEVEQNRLVLREVTPPSAYARMDDDAAAANESHSSQLQQAKSRSGIGACQFDEGCCPDCGQTIPGCWAVAINGSVERPKADESASFAVSASYALNLAERRNPLQTNRLADGDADSNVAGDEAFRSGVQPSSVLRRAVKSHEILKATGSDSDADDPATDNHAQ